MHSFVYRSVFSIWASDKEGHLNMNSVKNHRMCLNLINTFCFQRWFSCKLMNKCTVCTGLDDWMIGDLEIGDKKKRKSESTVICHRDQLWAVMPSNILSRSFVRQLLRKGRHDESTATTATSVSHLKHLKLRAHRRQRTKSGNILSVTFSKYVFFFFNLTRM